MLTNTHRTFVLCVTCCATGFVWYRWWHGTQAVQRTQYRFSWMRAPRPQSGTVRSLSLSSATSSNEPGTTDRISPGYVSTQTTDFFTQAGGHEPPQ